MGLSEKDDYDFNWQKGSEQNRSTQEINTVDSGQSYFPLFPLGFAVIFITVLGIVGNVLSAFILTRKKLRSSSYSVLTLALTLVDSLYCMTKLIRYGLLSLFSHFGIFFWYTDVFLPTYGPVLRPITFIAHTASTYLTMIIAFDRYLIISRPHIARRYCTTKKARLFVIIALLFALFYNIPRWFESHTVTYNVGEGDEEARYKMVISDLRKDANYKIYYIFWAYLIVMFIIPSAFLIIINFFVWRGLKSIEESELMQTFTQSRDTSFSTMLMGVVVVFLLCNLDYLIVDLMDYFGIDYPAYWNDVGNFLITVNSAVNFLIYCLCGHQFRDELRQVFYLACNNCQKNLGTQSQDYFTTTGVWLKEIPRRDKNLSNNRV